MVFQPYIWLGAMVDNRVVLQSRKDPAPKAVKNVFVQQKAI